jgi:biopolymer transport protein ExbD
MRFAKAESTDTSPNIAPLLDVVLLLLIFFVVTTSFVERQISLELPPAESGARNDESSLIVNIDAKGGIVLQDEPITRDDLALRFREAAGRDVQLEIRADTRASHGDVVSVLDLAQQTGLTHVGIAVDSGSGSPEGDEPTMGPASRE